MIVERHVDFDFVLKQKNEKLIQLLFKSKICIDKQKDSTLLTLISNHLPFL